MYKFERNYDKMVSVVITIIGVIIVGTLIVEGNRAQGNISEIREIFQFITKAAIRVGGWIIAIILETKFVPEDFNYTVEVKKGFLIFSWGDYDRRVMQNPFTAQINGKNITLYDGNAVITVPYDKKVMEFFEGLNK